LGWLGFWLQVGFGSLPLVLVVYYLMFSRAADSSAGLGFVAYLTIADLAILFFTALWSYRYTRLGKRLMDPERRPTESSVVGTVWTGVVASTIGMFFR